MRAESIPDTPPRRRLPPALGTLRIYAEVAVVAALVWQWWWHPASGVASAGEFVWPATSIEGSITGTASYLVVCALAGTGLGAVTLFRHRDSPLVCVAIGLLGGAAAGLLIAWLGHLLGPDSAAEVAERSVDGTRVLTDLRVEGYGAYATLAASALSVIAAWLLLGKERDPEPESHLVSEPDAGAVPPPLR